MLTTLLGLSGMAGLNLGSAFLNHSFNKEMQEDAQRHQIKMMKNAHQWQVQDLRNAGLNPILSAGGSPGSYGSSAISSGGADLGDGVVSAIEEAQKLENETAKKQSELLDEEIKLKKEEQNTNSALAEKYDSETFKNDLGSALDYSPDMIRLRKREMYSKGTPYLNQIGGEFTEAFDRQTGYQRWNYYENNDDITKSFNGPRRNYHRNRSGTRYTHK